MLEPKNPFLMELSICEEPADKVFEIASSGFRVAICENISMIIESREKRHIILASFSTLFFRPSKQCPPKRLMTIVHEYPQPRIF